MRDAGCKRNVHNQNNTIKCSLYMTMTKHNMHHRDVYYRIRERNECGITGAGVSCQYRGGEMSMKGGAPQMRAHTQREGKQMCRRLDLQGHTDARALALRRIVRKSRGWRKRKADAPARPSLPFHREFGGTSESTRGRCEGSCRRGEPCGAGHGVAPFRGHDTAGGARRSDGRHRLSRAGCQAAAVTVALFDHVRLEGQGSGDTVEFLSRAKKNPQPNSA